MRRSPLAALVIVLAAAVVTTPAIRSADRPVEPLVEKVKKAITEAADYLKREQKQDGSWQFRIEAANNGGGTALALLALINAGEPVKTSHIQRGLAFLRMLDSDKTYTVSLQTMVFAMAGEPEDLARIQRNVDWLEKARPTGLGIRGDQHVRRQLEHAVRAPGPARGPAGRTRVDAGGLRQMRQLFLDTQTSAGAWTYAPTKEVTGTNPPRFTMTTAGLCNLLITGMDLEKGKQKLNADG